MWSRSAGNEKQQQSRVVDAICSAIAMRCEKIPPLIISIMGVSLQIMDKITNGVACMGLPESDIPFSEDGVR